MSTASGQRHRKDLESTGAATRFQKAFGAELRERVVERGEPFAVAQADTPHEIFHAMDIPIASNQWWSAYISAKRLSGRYFTVLDELGLPPNRCNYCSLGLACSLARDPATAPWGGLPQPTVLVARLTEGYLAEAADLAGTAQPYADLRQGRGALDPHAIRVLQRCRDDRVASRALSVSRGRQRAIRARSRWARGSGGSRWQPARARAAATAR